MNTATRDAAPASVPAPSAPAPSVADLDRDHLVHPLSELRREPARHLVVGGEGIRIHLADGRNADRRALRAVEHPRGSWPPGNHGCRHGPDAIPRLLPRLLGLHVRAGRVARETPRRPRARAERHPPLPVHAVRLRRERDELPHRPPVPRDQGQPGPAEDPLPAAGLSRHHPRRRERDAPRHVPLVRQAGSTTCGSGYARPRGSRTDDRARRRRHHRGLRRGARDRHRRRHPPAARILRRRPRPLRPTRHPADLRRGRHRLRPHRKLVSPWTGWARIPTC